MVELEKSTAWIVGPRNGGMLSVAVSFGDVDVIFEQLSVQRQSFVTNKDN